MFEKLRGLFRDRKEAKMRPDAAIELAKKASELLAAYLQAPYLRAAAQFEQAVRIYEAVLDVITERDFPVQWAMIQNNLGVAYRDLPHGDRADNLLRAIACFQAALRVRTERDFPVQWATTQNNLGV